MTHQGEVERTKTVKSVAGLAQLAVAIVGLALLPRADMLTLTLSNIFENNVWPP